MLGVAVVGYGYWGPNLVRNFAESERTRVIAVSDLRPERLAAAARRHPGIYTTQDYAALLKDPAVEAVAIATNVSSHFELARLALEAGKHVLVEKPITSSAEQAIQLIELAQKRSRTLMVDHTFVYTSAVRKIRELVAGGELGQVYYYDSVRINLGLFQHDINVIWDLAVHDLAILDYVLASRPTAVSATGMSHIEGGTENIAYLTLFFGPNLIAHVHVNWLAPVKIRRTLIGGSRKMVVYDDLEGSEKLRIFDKGVVLNGTPESVYQMRINYRAGDMWAPHLDNTEALRVEICEFIECVETGRQPTTGGHAGLNVVRILEAACESLKQRGALVSLEQGATV